MRSLRIRWRWILIGCPLLGFFACSDSPVGVETAVPEVVRPAPAPPPAPAPEAKMATAAPAPAPRRARLILPDLVALPYVHAGEGPVSKRIEVVNVGDASALAPDGGPLRFVLEGDPTLSLTSAPSAVAPGGRAMVEVTFAGASEEKIASAALLVAAGGTFLETTVHAVAGDPELGPAVFAPVLTPAGVHCGEGATVDMPAAPYPHPEGYFSDPSVRIFVPEGYRDLPGQDLVVHFHGHSTTLEETLRYHRYQEHLYASGANALLVVPQGPVDRASSDFGKLMDEGGLARLLDEVLVLLYREGRIRHPVVGDVMLTAHSGGFRAVASNLTQYQPFLFSLVGLYDALYGDTPVFVSFPGLGGLLRSSFSPWGGTTDQNRLLAKRLAALGVEAKDALTQRQLRAAEVIVAFADTSHSDVTRLDGAFGEVIRFAAPHSRRGPRIELRTAVAAEGQARITFLAPPDGDATGIRVEISDDAERWRSVDETEPDAGESTFSLSGGAFVRVSGIVPYTKTPLASDVYRLDEGARVLIVDGFDRVVDGAWSGLSHDFSARVSQAVGPVHTVSHRALVEDGFDPKAYPVLLWLLGDESSLDLTLDPDERKVITAYLLAGGRLIAAGSELASDLDEVDSHFLESTFGASHHRDDAKSSEVKGVGPLAHLGSLTLGGATAPYVGFRPDTLSPEPEGEVLLRYASGTVAAVGLGHRSVIVGFSLELVTDEVELASLMAALLDWVK